jgi:hypothetical protein
MLRRICLLALAFGVPGFADAADIPATPAAPVGAPRSVLFQSYSLRSARRSARRRLGARGRLGRSQRRIDLSQNLHCSRMARHSHSPVPCRRDGQFGRRTSYGYAGALWTLNYDRYFTEVFFGGAVPSHHAIGTTSWTTPTSGSTSRHSRRLKVRTMTPKAPGRRSADVLSRPSSASSA